MQTNVDTLQTNKMIRENNLRLMQTWTDYNVRVCDFTWSCSVVCEHIKNFNFEKLSKPLEHAEHVSENKLQTKHLMKDCI